MAPASRGSAGRIIPSLRARERRAREEEEPDSERCERERDRDDHRHLENGQLASGVTLAAHALEPGRAELDLGVVAGEAAVCGVELEQKLPPDDHLHRTP